MKREGTKVLVMVFVVIFSRPVGGFIIWIIRQVFGGKGKVLNFTILEEETVVVEDRISGGF